MLVVSALRTRAAAAAAEYDLRDESQRGLDGRSMIVIRYDAQTKLFLAGPTGPWLWADSVAHAPAYNVRSSRRGGALQGFV